MSQAEKVASGAELFVKAALVEGNSLFTPGKRIWSQAVLDDLHQRYVACPDESDARLRTSGGVSLKGLRPDDVIVTFNYDLLLERSLDAVGKKYRRFPDRFSSIGLGGASVDTEEDEIFRRRRYSTVLA